eukprot:TRINITY_DN19734_c0_g2_i1.p1 TRINITY_DN19734_c0_g2~~TRINITY_DN19734_c0_g2_i1.p1  ORF type:complete len:627 (+),score=200.60 TRINITY_DN19734_c0_g2_i1:87-1883(+)
MAGEREIAEARRAVEELERAIRAKEKRLDLKRRMQEHSDREALEREREGQIPGGSGGESQNRVVWRPLTLRVDRVLTGLDELKERLARVSGIELQRLQLQLHLPGQGRKPLSSVAEAVDRQNEATIEVTEMASGEDPDDTEVLVEGGLLQEPEGVGSGDDILTVWSQTSIRVRRQWTYEQFKHSLAQLTGIPPYLMRVHNQPPVASSAPGQPRIEFLNMEQVWKTSLVVFWVTRRTLDSGDSASVSPEELERAVALSEAARSEREKDLHRIEQELRRAHDTYQSELQRRERLLRELRGAAEQLRHGVSERGRVCADYLQKLHGGRKPHAAAGTCAAVRAADGIQRLTRERETAIRHAERELQELRILTQMKDRRQAELRAENARRAAAEEKVRNAARAEVLEKIQREREDLEGRRNALQRDHDDLSDTLHWSRQHWTSREETPSMAGTPRRGPSRERLRLSASASPRRSVPGSPRQPGVVPWSRRTEGDMLSSDGGGAVSPKRGVVGAHCPIDRDDVAQNSVALATVQAQREADKAEIRRLTTELNSFLAAQSRMQKEAEARAREQQRIAEEAEKECAQLEEQAEFLAKELEALRGRL